MPLLKVENLSVSFPRRPSILRRHARRVKAVDDVSFEIEENTVAGLIGERGCGITSLTHALGQVIRPSSGTILYRDKDILKSSRRALRPVRREIQLLFQNCRASLNQFHPIKTTLIDTIRGTNRDSPISAIDERAIAALEQVGLPPETANLLPRELPHGHAERVALARALSIDAKLILIDDSLRSLDLRPRRQFIDLLLDLKEKLGLTCLLACHDFSLLMLAATDTLVMAHGRIVEASPVAEIVENPKHDFTKKLLASTLSVN